MNKVLKFLLLLLIFNVSLFSEEWSKIIKHSSGTEVTIYQPQVKSFDKIILEFRSAVMINTPKQTDPIFGAVWVKTKILTDLDIRLISLDEVVVTDAKFPD